MTSDASKDMKKLHGHMEQLVEWMFQTGKNLKLSIETIYHSQAVLVGYLNSVRLKDLKNL